MRYFRLLIPVLLSSLAVQAQKAWQGDVTAFIGRIPIPGTSSTCYAGSTKVTDASNGMVSIKDNGVGYTSIETQFTDIMKGAMYASSAPGATGTGGAPSSGDVAIMKLIGQAQTAAGHINQMSMELGQKMAKLNKGLDAVKIGPNCPEVQQGGYAGPTCACLQAHALDYYTRRVAVMDSYVSQVAALVREYLGRMQAETAIIDDMEAKAKYGDAVSNPAFRQMVVSVQRQSFVAVTSLLSTAGSGWRDGATEYANYMNAKSGASVPCGKK